MKCSNKAAVTAMAVTVGCLTLFYFKMVTDSSPHDGLERSIKLADKSLGLTEKATTEAMKKSVDTRKMTIEQREKFQQAQVDQFCRLYGEKLADHSMYDRQMLVNDEVEVAYCYIPKAGCSTLKVLFFLTLGALPVARFTDNVRDSSDEGYYERAISQHSFKAKNETEKEQILKTYKKLMIYRNPVSRLVSGYLSKVDQYPLIGLEASKPAERNWLRLAIYKYTHPEEFAVWKENGAAEPIHISFVDFVAYWIKNKGLSIDEHFRTSIHLCTPCKVRYSYYGKFEDFAEESVIFSDMIHGNRSHIFKVPKQLKERVVTLESDYYAQISEEQKIAIVDLLSLDLGLYYALFPEERGSHKTIMGLDNNSTIPTISKRYRIFNSSTFMHV